MPKMSMPCGRPLFNIHETTNEQIFTVFPHRPDIVRSPVALLTLNVWSISSNRADRSSWNVVQSLSSKSTKNTLFTGSIVVLVTALRNISGLLASSINASVCLLIAHSSFCHRALRCMSALDFITMSGCLDFDDLLGILLPFDSILDGMIGIFNVFKLKYTIIYYAILTTI